MPDRDVEFVLSATDRTSPAARSAADGFEKVDRSATGAARAIDEVGDQAGQAARKLLEARVAASGLAREFNKTGDSKLLKDFEKVNREAARLGRVMKTLKFDAPEVKNTSGVLAKFVKFGKEAGLISGDAAIDSFSEAFKALPAPAKAAMIGTLVGVAVVAAPLIAAAAEGAVLAGVGAGGIGAGILLAAKDPKVVQEYTDLGHRIKLKLDEGFTKPFKADLLQAVPLFSDAFDQEAPRLNRIAASLAPVLTGLIKDAVAAVHAIMPSVERAAIVGGQILGNLGKQLPGLARDVGKLLDAFAEAGPGASAALGAIVGQLQAFIYLIGESSREAAPLLNLMGKLLELSGLAPDTGGKVSVLTDMIKTNAMAASAAATDYSVLAQSMGNTANQARQLQSNFDALFGTMMSVDQANLAVNVGMSQLTETIKGNKKTLDESTAAGQQNVGAILQQITALDQKRQADIAAGNGTVEATQQANAAYASNVGALRQVLISLGLAASAVDALIAKYAAIPRTISTTISTVFRTSGTPPGYSDQLTGHSRTGGNDYSGLSGWAPAEFNARSSLQLAAAAEARSTASHQPPTQVHAENTFNVMLDGAPFRAMTVRSVSAAEARQAWRNKTGRR